MRADADGRKIDDAGLFPDPGVVAHFKFPWDVDVDPRFPIDALSNLRPKKPQEP
jgi:hypothetical protein